MYDDVLIATDGSSATERALRHALGIAERFDARLHVLYVVDTRLVELFGGERRETVLRESRAAGDQVTREVVDRADDRGVAAVSEVREGTPHEVVLAYADEAAVDLVAMGSHSNVGTDTALLGSTAERVVGRADCAVLTARPVERDEHTEGVQQFDDLLVPVDGSDPAERAADHAIELAEMYGANVHFVYVVDSSTYDSGDAPRSVVGMLEEAGQNEVDALAERAADLHVSASTSVERGVAHERIVEYADDEDADLVVMGSRGKTGGEGWFLGSTTDRVLRTVDQPVLTLR